MTKAISAKRAKKNSRVVQQQKSSSRIPMRPKLLPSIVKSDEVVKRKIQWTNRERVLVIASRGISYLGRHLLKDLLCMLPHGRGDSKLDTKEDLSSLNELAEIHHTSKILYFEARKKKDLYLWLSCSGNGPSAKFLVENINTTAELKLTGNCLKTSRPILAFDPSFESAELPHLRLLRELFVQTLGTPNHHPKSQPFIDKVFSFTNFNKRIWFRTYQVAEESGALVEVGPRFSLCLIKIFAGSFCGAVLYSNPDYVSPNSVRRAMHSDGRGKYVARTQAKLQSRVRKKSRKNIYEFDKTDDIFD